MRKLKHWIPFLLLSVALLGCLFSCGKKETPTFSLSFNGAILSWEKISNASYYTVNCTFPDGTGYSVSSKTESYACPQSAAGDYLYTVTAHDKSKKIVARSESIVYHLGEGSYADPYLISGADELKTIFSGSVEVAFGKTKVEAPLHYRLEADIDLSGAEWTPIGNTSTPFIGVFDGNGHKITGLTLKTCNADAKVGLFGSIKNAVIKNLTLEGASLVFGKDSNVKGNSINVGLLCGYANASVFDNCRVTGEMKILEGISTTGSVNMYAGGAIGQVASGKIFKTSFEGTVYAQYSCVFLGGLLGYASNASPRFVMTNSYANATVEASATGYNLTSKTSTAIARAGVLAGSIAGSDRISSCLAIGSASASTTRDGTSESSITSGVFGNTAGSSGINSVPIYNLFYSASVPQVSGTRAKLGTGQTAYPLTEEELKNKEKYLVGESYALDFEKIWEMKEEGPALRRSAITFEPLPLSVTFKQIRGEKTELVKSFSLRDTFNPSYFALSVSGMTAYYCGYHLNTILNSMGADLVKAQSIGIFADGEEVRTFPVTDGSFSSTYLTCGAFDAYEFESTLYEAYRLIDAASLTVYDDLTPKILEIVVTCSAAEEGGENA
ncbi:MAG: hypothetical protein K5753_07105 [Clostridia bacterium]|nr:hypothetical protein [Clostridia bacterium]